jgi:uncharacterized protein (DUF111 family)
VPLGSGFVRSEHGPLPVPAPATVLLLQGLEIIRDGVPGERVTPTGAAILRHLVSGPAPARSARLGGAGVGFGSRRLPGISNCVRALRLDAATSVWREHPVGVIEFEVDDQTPEDLSVALEHLRDQRGVLDVVQTAVMGKKNRLVSSIRILSEPGHEDDIALACFDETTTIGVRVRRDARKVLTRREAEATLDGQKLRTKRVDRPKGASAKTDIDDVSHVVGHERREALRRRAAYGGEGGER